MRRGAVIWIAIGVLACAAVAWNGVRFQGTRQQPRAKDLDFLPPPLVAQALSLGQSTAVAKLRWIDSFAYFQLQLDRLDDRVAGDDPRGGFERLYDTLLAMDPLFVPFYEHAVLNTGGVLKQHRAALACLMRGLLAMPGDSSLWRMASAELAISFGWNRRAPVALDRWLKAWSDSEADEGGRQLVTDWRRGLAFATIDGLDTISYWMQQLHGMKPGTPLYAFAENMVRELLAERGARELTDLCGGPPPPGRIGRILAEPLLPGAPIRPDPARVAARWPRGVPAWLPVRWDGREAGLRSDPFGYDWVRQGGRVLSPGREQRRFLVLVQAARNAIEAEANARGRSPRDAAEAAAWGVELPDPPFGGRWSFANRLPEVVWPEPPHQPWQLR